MRALFYADGFFIVAKWNVICVIVGLSILSFPSDNNICRRCLLGCCMRNVGMISETLQTRHDIVSSRQGCQVVHKVNQNLTKHHAKLTTAAQKN